MRVKSFSAAIAPIFPPPPHGRIVDAEQLFIMQEVVSLLQSASTPQRRLRTQGRRSATMLSRSSIGPQ
jgi:hypothetical protein